VDIYGLAVLSSARNSAADDQDRVAVVLRQA
jgi:hypothetical protein